MPRYFIDTYDGRHTRDEAGVELAGPHEVRAYVRRALGHLLIDERGAKPTAELRADARDEAGKHIMTASVCMVIADKT